MLFSVSQKRKSSFTIIELLITMAIVGLLIVTIIPLMGRYNRNNGATMSAQQIREAISETLSYATSPDPGNCPMIESDKVMPSPIIGYMFYYGAATPSNYFKDEYYGYQDKNIYICGIDGITSSMNLKANQYAILAISANHEDPSILYTSGIVRIGTLDGSVTFCSPLDGTSASGTISFGFNVPSGDIYIPPDANTNYLSTLNSNIYSLGNRYVVQSAAAGKFLMIGIKTIDNFMQTIFFNTTSGQVTSTGKVPAGFLAS